MRNDRRAILSLVALGRITPAEAERLLAVWNGGREDLWVIAACVAACRAQLDLHSLLWPLTRLARAFSPDNISALHHALSVVTLWIGGSL